MSDEHPVAFEAKEKVSHRLPIHQRRPPVESILRFKKKQVSDELSVVGNRCWVDLEVQEEAT